MTSMFRNLACALAVSTAWGATAAIAFDLALAVLPRPQLAAAALVHRPLPQGVRVESTVAEAGANLAGS